MATENIGAMVKNRKIGKPTEIGNSPHMRDCHSCWLRNHVLSANGARPVTKFASTTHIRPQRCRKSWVSKISWEPGFLPRHICLRFEPQWLRENFFGPPGLATVRTLRLAIFGAHKKFAHHARKSPGRMAMPRKVPLAWKGRAL